MIFVNKMRTRGIHNDTLAALRVVGLAASLGLAACTSEVPEGLRPMPPEAVSSAIEAEDGPLLLDVRTAKEFKAGRIAGAVNIPLREIRMRTGELEPYRERGIILYCETGLRVEVAAAVLEGEGFERLWEIPGHLKAWRANERPVEK